MNNLAINIPDNAAIILFHSNGGIDGQLNQHSDIWIITRRYIFFRPRMLVLLSRNFKKKYNNWPTVMMRLSTLISYLIYKIIDHIHIDTVCSLI